MNKDKMSNSSLSPLENNNWLQAIFNNAIDGIININERGIIETMNPAAGKIFGYSPDEIIGKNINVLMPEPDHSQHDSYISNYKSTGIAKIIGKGREVKGKKKDGTIFPFLLSISESVLENKRMFTGIVHDITALKKAEASVSESEQKINSIINTAVDGIITIDDRGIIEMVNPSCLKIFRYDQQEELVGKNISVLMPEPEKTQHDGYIKNYKETGKKKIIGIGREVTGLRKDGTTFPFILSVSEMQINNGKRLFTGFVHDITQQKLTEEKLRRYTSELERSNRELQDFAYVSSHDLQEPLRKIQAFGDRLKSKEAPHLSEQGKDYIDRMLNAASRMQKLINDLLTFSRVSSNQQPFKEVNLNTVIKGVLSDLEIIIEQKKAKIEIDNLPTIEADETQIRQLFQNLIGNAIKFSKPDQPPHIKIKSEHIQKQAHLTSTPGDEITEIVFEDNGIGFDEKYADKIFNIFQRLEGQKYEGSGIGLAICKKIAMRHGGDIFATSKPGEGSIFKISLSNKQVKNN